MLAALLAMRDDELFAVDRDRSVTILAGTREGLRFAWHEPEVRIVLIVVTVVGLMGFNFNTLVPLLASDTLHVDARAFGLLSAAFGLGAFAGALAVASFRRATYRAFACGTVGFSVLLLALAPVHDARAAGVLLFGIGACFTLFAANANAIVQLAAPDLLRGRLVALYLFAFVGLAPLGSLLSGLLVELGGTALAFSLAGVTGLATITAASRGRRRIRGSETGRRRHGRHSNGGAPQKAADADTSGARALLDQEEWMTIFGNRDSGYGGSPMARSPPRFSRTSIAEPRSSTRDFGAATDPRRVILRVHGDEDIVVGSADGREHAVQHRARHGATHRAGVGARASGRRSTSASSAPARSSRSTCSGPNSPFEGPSPGPRPAIHLSSTGAVRRSEPPNLEDRRGSARGHTSPPTDRAVEWAPSELRRVVIRLAGGEVVQLGTAPNRQSALVLARTFIAEIEEPQGEWPLVGDRMLRPDSIVSVDVLTNT